MARKQYTEEEKAAYKRGLAAQKKKRSPARKSGTTASRSRGRRTRTATTRGKGKKRSKCSMVLSYPLKSTGEVVNRPRISAYRIDKNFGYQKLVAFLGKDEGEVKNPDNRERFLNFVVTLTSKAGKTTLNGLWDTQYKYLKLIELGLVAKPNAPNGGYFGPGGARLKGKVTK